MQDFAMYAQETSVEKVANNILTPPRSEPSPKHEEGQIAVFSQPPQFQKPLIYNGSQQNQQQNFAAYLDNYPYVQTSWNYPKQTSWNYPNYYGHNYYPSIHGQSSGIIQPATQYYQQPHHSKLYGDYNGTVVNNENLAFNPNDLTAMLSRPKRTRTFYSTEQILELETYFETKQFLPRAERVKLSEKIQLSEKQVKVWFQNRRTKHKKALGSSCNPTSLAVSNKTRNIKGETEVKTEVIGNDDMERITSTIDENAEAVILREIQNSAQAEAFAQGANYMASRPDEVQNILNAVSERKCLTTA